MEHRIPVALGKEKADLVLKNGRYVNVFTNELLEGNIAIHEGYFVGMGDYAGKREIDLQGKVIIPSFIDGHIHLESAMISPYEFAQAVLCHGTTTVVADPHEIANVLGTDGIDYMLQSTEGLPLDVYLMLPSCVPATPEDENGAKLTHHELVPYLRESRVLGLGEVMDARGVLKEEKELMDKITSTLAYDKRVDGHAPALAGGELNAYISAGITSDHECTTQEEALEKLRDGMWVMVREGTAAKNIRPLIKLFEEKYHFRCMLVSDDRHAGELKDLGHMDYLVKKAISLGANPILAIKMASFNAAKYFRLSEIGAIGVNYKANFIITSDIEKLDVLAVYKEGKQIYDQQEGLQSFQRPQVDKALQRRVTSTFHMRELEPKDFAMEPQSQYTVIELEQGQITTHKKIVSDLNGCVKLAVVERHKGTGHMGKGYLAGYGLRSGAIATSIAHDSHNLIVAGRNDVDMAVAANCIRENEGGLAIALNGKIIGKLPLPIAGLMSDESVEQVKVGVEQLKQQAVKLGVMENIDPFMTLSFVSLPVIPQIRLTTKGLIEVT